MEHAGTGWKDPFYRDNEFKALELVKGDYTFVKAFDADPALLSQAHQVLRFDGVDTISDIYLNGMWIGSTMDMHTAYEFDVRGLLLESGNELKVCIKSPTRWIAQRDKEHHLGGSIEAMENHGCAHSSESLTGGRQRGDGSSGARCAGKSRQSACAADCEGRDISIQY